MQSDDHLRGLHVARQQQLLIDICIICCAGPQQQTCRPPPLLSIDGTEPVTGPFFDAYRIQCSKPVLVLFLKCISQVKYHFPLQCQYCAERGGGANFPPTTVVCSHSFPFLSRFFPLLSHLCSPFYQTIPFLTY